MALISTQPYWDVSLTVDRDGVVHAAADEPDLVGSSIYYITNATGGWTQERLLEGSATGDSVTAFWAPTIGQDDADGSLSLSFQFVENRYPDDLGYWLQATPTYLTLNRSGDWSRPVRIGQGDAPSVVVGDGVVHFAAQGSFHGDVTCVGELFPLAYRTDATGKWTSEEVDRNGLSAQLALAADGLPRILYSGTNTSCASDSTIGSGLVYATATGPTGQFEFEDVPGTPYDKAIALAVDADERPHILFHRARKFDGEFGELWYAFRVEDGWSLPELVLPRTRPMRAVLDGAGFFHVLARQGGAVGRQGGDIVYVTNRGGSWRSTPLWTSPGAATGALALDSAGRPHVLLSTEIAGADSTRYELWYAVGPAP